MGELSGADFGAEGDGLVGVVAVGDFGSVFDEVDCFGVGEGDGDVEFLEVAYGVVFDSFDEFFLA